MSKAEVARGPATTPAARLHTPKHDRPLDVYSYAAAETLRHDRRPDEAEPEFRKALSLQSSLVSRFPDVVPYKAWKAIIQDALAKLLSDHRQMKEACSLLEASTAALRKIRETEPEVPYIDRLLKRSYDNLADVYVRLAQEDLAAEALRRAEQCREDRRPPPPLPRD
jgi:tetratricopeptide (TPR) repeat protein